MNKDKLKGVLWLPFCADAYALGGHWIYDTEKIANAGLDMDTLNDPLTSYHVGKKAGDFTHFGDKAMWLMESISEQNGFLLPEFAEKWQEKMKVYDGYIDGASRETLENLESGKSALAVGSSSNDLSVVGEIGSLIYSGYEDVDRLNESVKLFTLFTHMNKSVFQTANYATEVVMMLLNGAELEASLQETSKHYGDDVETWVQKGISLIHMEPNDAVKECGPACSVDQGLSGAIYFIFKYKNDYTSMMQDNILAGGDSAARGMFIALIMGAYLGWEKTRPTWVKQIRAYDEIKKFQERNG